jgi:hypothetical protein
MITLTRQEKESGIITTAVFIAVFLLLFFLKTSLPDKEEEIKKEPKPVELELEGGGGGGGTMINFGSAGPGARMQQDENLPTEEVVGSADDKAEADVNTAPVITRDRTMQNQRPETTPTPPARPRNNALDNILGGQDASGNGNGLSNGDYGQGGTGGGRGTGNGSGDGSGTGLGSGSGSGGGSGAGRGTGVGDYNLAGRKALTKPKPGGCNENGTVVVQITVDRSGKVIKTETGRGTNASPCLIANAKSAAMSTKWDAGTSDKQVGTITYNFKVTD